MTADQAAALLQALDVIAWGLGFVVFLLGAMFVRSLGR